MNLETERLRIRDLRPSDRPVVRAWRADPDIMRYLDSRDDIGADGWLDRALGRNAARPRLYHDCAIELRPAPESGRGEAGPDDPDHETGAEVAGWISIGHSPNFLTKDWVVGYLLRREYWSRGYATEALGAVLTYGFEVLAAPRVYAECYLANTASARVMERAGMRCVGQVPSGDPSLGESVRYVLTREERSTPPQGSGPVL